MDKVQINSTSITATTPIVVTPDPITVTGTVSHATSGVTAATYGDSTHYPVITVNATGHLTTVTSQAFSGADGDWNWGKAVALQQHVLFTFQ